MTVHHTFSLLSPSTRAFGLRRAAVRLSLGGIGLVSAGALALSLIAGAGQASAASRPRAAAPATLAHGDTAQAIPVAEFAVASAPRDGAARAALGRAYLRDGRYESAVTALGDAVTLGENGSRTLLALALAQVATGQTREALATLDQGQQVIPASDLGLAVALAGDAARGARILNDALTAGDKSDKLRANLAYAYALDGKWTDARSLLATELTTDKVDARLTEWAQLARPDATRQRVALLLGAPTKSDPGMPPALALNTAPASAAAPSQLAASAPMAAPAVATSAVPELPAVATIPARPAPVFTQVAPQMAAAAPMARTAYSAPASRPDAAVKLADAAPAKVKSMPGKAIPARPMPAVSGTHMVQLGAFSSEANAQRARALFAKRDGTLRHRDVQITRATVNGRSFWRVGVGGFDSAQASTTCNTLQKKGSVCFAYTAGRLPGEASLALARR